MAILREHIPYLAEIFSMDGFLRDPVLEFGSQDCLDKRRPALRSRPFLWAKLLFAVLMKRRPLSSFRFRPMPATIRKFQAGNLREILRNHGCVEIRTLDLFDARADYRHDMNNPLPPELNRQFKTVIDIGSIEHVFDARQCLTNLFNLVADDGHLMLQAPCFGYFNNGFHTFSPECLLQALALNGFEVRNVKYTTSGGAELTNPEAALSATIWIVARKQKMIGRFVVPQQGRWQTAYQNTAKPAVS